MLPELTRTIWGLVSARAGASGSASFFSAALQLHMRRSGRYMMNRGYVMRGDRYVTHEVVGSMRG